MSSLYLLTSLSSIIQGSSLGKYITGILQINSKITLQFNIIQKSLLYFLFTSQIGLVLMNYFQPCFICRPSVPTVPEETEVELIGAGGQWHHMAFSRQFCQERGGGPPVTGVEGVDRVKEVGVHPHPQQAGPTISSSLIYARDKSGHFHCSSLRVFSSL